MTVSGYSRTQIALHWSVATLLAVEFFSHEGIKPAFRSVLNGQDLGLSLAANLHLYSGFAILALVLLRLFLRLKRGVPGYPEGGSSFLEAISKLTHWAIYALLLAIPVSGIWAWYGASSSVGGLHETLWNIGWVLVALHTIAALYHQYFLKDGLIKRMLKAG